MFDNDSISQDTRENWTHLINTFTPEYIAQKMKTEEYVLGLKEKSFAYLIEYGTNDLGKIWSHGVGFWMWADKKTKEIKHAKRWNGTNNVLFSEIKNRLSSLVSWAIHLTEFRDFPNHFFYHVIEHKIIFLFNPEIMIPVFSENDIHHFEMCLGLQRTNTYEEAQQQLVKYRKKHSNRWSNNLQLMRELYDVFNPRKKGGIDHATIEGNEALDEDLNKETRNYDFGDEDSFVYEPSPEDRGEPFTSGGKKNCYPRKRDKAINALKRAHHKCELDEEHLCFTRKTDGKPYTEPHHLIPMAFQKFFSKSLDVEANIVSLCSNCHNEIHYGEHADILIRKLYDARKDELLKAGIGITLDDLLKFYRLT